MRIEKIDRMISFLKLYCGITFNLFCELISVAITVALLFGSIASVTLLYKLFPSIGIKLLSYGFNIIYLFRILFNVIITLLVVFLISLVVFLLAKEFSKSNERIRRKKENFIKEVAVEVKRMNKRGRK